MKILQVIPYFEWSYGGPVRVLYEISRELTKRGHDVTIYTTDVGRRNPLTEKQKIRFDSNPKIHYFKCQNNWVANKLKLNIAFQMRSAIKDNLKDFDVVHLHEPRGIHSLIVWYYTKNNIPYVLQAHGVLPKTIPGQNFVVVCLKIIFDIIFGNSIVRDASKVIALTKTEAEQYREMGVHDEKIAIIPNGIDLSDYADLPSKGEFKKKFNIPEDKKIILYVGRIHRSKGIDLLLKAFAYLSNKMKCKDALLVVAGPNDGYLHEVKSLSASLVISNSVLFTGLISNKDKISAYVDSRMVVNVEPRNVFGLVPLEAAACLTPVIISKGNAISNVVHRGKFGFSVKYSKVNGLAKTMRMLLNDKNLAKEMGQKGRKYIFENYNWNNSIIKLEKVYEEVANENQSRARIVNQIEEL